MTTVSGELALPYCSRGLLSVCTSCLISRVRVGLSCRNNVIKETSLFGQNPCCSPIKRWVRLNQLERYVAYSTTSPPAFCDHIKLHRGFYAVPRPPSTDMSCIRSVGTPHLRRDKLLEMSDSFVVTHKYLVVMLLNRRL